MEHSERKTQTVQFQSWEVGGELLDILSRGLYSDAKAALREYVQNGVDARAQNITITVDGPKAVIRDDGVGMGLDEMRAARRFGMSNKSPMHAVGFRGIGIYSAFGICEEMTITSRQKGMDGRVGWRFRFGDMRRLLEDDKRSDVRQGVGLPGLMLQYTELFEEPHEGSPDDHFTVVELEGIDEEYRAQLNDASEVNNYLLNTVPVAFGSEGYGETVNGWLVDHVDLNPVRIALRIGDEDVFDVLPPVAEGVYNVELGWVNDAEGNPLAFAWYALSKNGRQLPSYEGASVSGFLLKMKGFTLGRRDLLKPLWPATGGRSLYHHYTGEVHILDPGRLYPNAARDDLESNPGKQVFELALSTFFHPMSRKARAMQAKARAERLLDGTEELVKQLKIENEAPDTNPFETHGKAKSSRNALSNVHSEIERHMRATKGRDDKPQFDPAQEGALNDALDELLRWMEELEQVERDAQARTLKRRREIKQAPPQSDLLQRTLAAVEAMSERSDEPRFKRAATDLQPYVKSVAMVRAIGVLDDLKADGIELGSEVEGCRKELRTAVGWDPMAPVSLEEALGQQGVSLEADEESLIVAIDHGLVVGLGGRGEAYEAVIRSIADSVTEEKEG